MDALPEGALLLVLSYAAPIQYVSDAPMPWQPGLSAIAAVCKAWRALSQRLAVQQVIFCAQSDTKVASLSDWLQHHAPQLSGVSLYNPWQLRGPSSNRPLAALAAAATSSAAAGRPLRLRRLVLDVAQPKGGTAHEVVGQLLGAVPSLRHLHLRLLPLPPRFGRGNAEMCLWNQDTFAPLLSPLRRLTRLTSFVLVGPFLESEEQEQHAGACTFDPVRTPDPWVADMCAALPPSLLDIEWATWNVNVTGIVHELRLPLQLNHLTALTRLAVTVNTSSAQVVLPGSVFQPLGVLQQLQLTGMMPPLTSAPLQAQCLVHWGPCRFDMLSARAEAPAAAAALRQMEACLPSLKSLDLASLQRLRQKTALDALACSGSQLTRLHMQWFGLGSEQGGYDFSSVTYPWATGLRSLGLDVRDTGVEPPLLTGLQHLSYLEVHVIGEQCVIDTNATAGLWPAAIAPLTQLKVLSVSAQLLATEEPWLMGLSQLVVLQLLPFAYPWWSCPPVEFNIRISRPSLEQLLQHIRQAALAPGTALQLVLVTPGVHIEHDLRAELQEGGWPSQVAVLVGTLAWLAAAGREAWPPELWRVVEGPVVPTGAAHHWYL